MNSKLVSIIVIVIAIVGVSVGVGMYLTKEDGGTTTATTASSSSDDEDEEETAVLDDVDETDITPFIDHDQEDVNLAVYYKCDNSMYYDGSNTSSIYLIFKKDSTDFSCMYGNTEIATGIYSVDGNDIIIAEDDSSSAATVEYLMLDDYLVHSGTICNGTIPDTDTFDATCYCKTSDTTAYYYEFHKDGSYTLRMVKAGDDEDSSVEGTYERDGDKINVIINGNATAPYLVYDGTLITNFYETISAAQYKEEFQQNEIDSSESTESN